jgi:uncharacterized protein (TIGR02996 family)
VRRDLVSAADDRARELLAGVMAAPEDLARRLVYADFLQEQGDPRGELIVLQCRLHMGAPVPELGSLRAREQELLATHAQAWLAELGLEAGEGTWLCGMVEILHTTGERLRHHALRLAEQTPIRGLHLERVTPPLGPSLRLLPYLRFLVARGADLGDTVLADLARTDPFRGLVRLEASRNRITDAGARSLASTPSLKDLTLLELGHNRVGLPGVRALAQSPHLVSLATLGLDRNPFGDEGVAALVEGPRASALCHLSLVGCGLGPQAAHTLANAPALAGLVSLDLAYNDLGTAGALALARSPHLQRLTRLRISGNRASGAALMALQERFGESPS